ncbi:MAG: PT domain-containing protein [Clostridia bacterium]|nr:PT domain-containing protein [Clostridia bacterium]
MKRLSALILILAFALCLAGCRTSVTPDPAADPTEAPEVTAEPTGQPTEAPSENPTEIPDDFAFNGEDAEKLRTFFETADETGVKNGQKLFPEYDPEKPASWASDFYRLGWNEEGRLEGIYLSSYMLDEAEPVVLTGCFELSDLPELAMIEIGEEVSLEDLSVSGCPKLASIFVYCPVKNQVIIKGALPEMGCDVCGELVMTDFGPNGYGVCIASNGDGWVGYRYREDDSLGEFVHELYALPHVGHEFVGWYDEMGDLYSDESVLNVTEAVPSLGDEFVLSGTFGVGGAPFAFYDGEAPEASGILAEVEPGKPVEFDLDFDGKPDTIELVDNGSTGNSERARTYTVYVTLGSDPENRILLDAFEDIESCALRVLDCDTGDERLDLLFNAFGAQLSEIVVAWRINDEGSFSAFPIGRMAIIVTDSTEAFDAHGSFDATLGIPIATRTEIFDTQYLPARMTLTDEGFRLIGPFQYAEPSEHNHGWRELKRDMEVLKLYNGRADEEITLPAGTKFAPVSTDMWSWVDIRLEDGSAYRVEIEVRGGFEVFINGLPQDEFCEIWVAE